MKKQITPVLMATLVFFLFTGFYSQVKAQDIKSFRADFFSVLDLYQEYGAFLQSNKEIYKQYLKHIDKARQMIKMLSNKELALMAVAHANLLDLKSALQDLLTKGYCKDCLSIEPKEMEIATFGDLPNADYPSCLRTSYLTDVLALEAYTTAGLFKEMLLAAFEEAGPGPFGVPPAEVTHMVFFIAETAYEQYKLCQDSYSGAEIEGTYNRIGIHDNNLREHDSNMLRGHDNNMEQAINTIITLLKNMEQAINTRDDDIKQRLNNIESIISKSRENLR